MKGTLFANVDYPSRKKKIQELSEIAVNDGLNQCRQYKASPVNYVTHSLGGILVRQFYKNHRTSNVKRVVMLRPQTMGAK
jgi:triacylglycerol esterase/lipase EstA (alpha/beta hydrolase family)